MVLILKAILYIWIVLVILGAFLWAPLASGLGEYTRIFYFHVPMAWLAVLSFLISAVYSIQFIRRQRIEADMIAESANQLGLLFAILATVSGSIWAKVSWGSFWNWDPRETSIFLLLLVYAAYFALRSAIDQPERKAMLSSVYSILAFVTVPFFVFIVPRVYASLHPDPLINPQGKIHMESRMLITFLASLAGFTALFIWILLRKIEIIRLKADYKKWSRA
jgi:heme exporter protein C